MFKKFIETNINTRESINNPSQNLDWYLQARKNLILKFGSQYIIAALRKLGFALVVDGVEYLAPRNCEISMKDDFYGLKISKEIFEAFVKCEYKTSSGTIKALLL